MRTKKEVPPLSSLNFYQQSILQDGYSAPYPRRVQTLYQLYILCGSNISLMSEYLRKYFPCFPIQNRNSLALMIKRHDSYSIALKLLSEDVETYSEAMNGCMDTQTLEKLLWKIRRRVYLRNVTEPSGSTLDLEEECD